MRSSRFAGAARALALGLGVCLVLTLWVDIAEAAAAPPASCGDMSPTLPDSPGAEEYRALVDTAVAYVAAPAHLNRSLGVTTRVVLCAEDNARGDGAETVTTYAGDTVTGCTFPIYPTGVSRAADPATATSMLTHEVFHCFLVVRAGRALGDPPAWFWEGSAAWAGESAAGGSGYSANWWHVYLTQPRRTLFERDYSAIGFFAHVSESGIDPWRVFDNLAMAARGSTAVPLGMDRDQYLFLLAIADNPTAFLDSWPAGLARDSSLGSAWDTSGPGLTADTYAAPVLGLEEMLNVAAGANDLVSIDLDGDVVHLDTIPDGPNGRLRASDGSEHDVTSADFCLRPDGCACPPPGPSLPGDIARLTPGPALLAVTGHVPNQAQPDSGTRVRLSRSTLEDACARRAADRPGTGGPGGGPVSDRCAGYSPGEVLRAQVEREDSLIQSECFYTIPGSGWTWVRFHDPPFTLADGRPMDVATAFNAAVAAAQAGGIGDDRAPVKVQALSGSGSGVCITPAERPTRNDVRGHVLVQRGTGWIDVALLDTRASTVRNYPPLCEMLASLAASVP